MLFSLSSDSPKAGFSPAFLIEHCIPVSMVFFVPDKQWLKSKTMLQELKSFEHHRIPNISL